MTHDGIIDYYNRSHNAYKDAWDLDNSMQLNLGFWYEDTKNLPQALSNLNASVAGLAEAGPGKMLLDAGCGVGGTSIYMAGKHQCQTHGITLVPRQAEQAKANARKNDVSDLTDYQIMDYCHTSFPDNHFDIILGIESICHAHSKRDFLKEAFRILRPGGRLVLAENLQAKEELTDREQDILYRFGFHGCKITSLDTGKQYLTNLKELGFSQYQCEDKTALVWPSIRRLRRIYYLAWLYNNYRALRGKPYGETEKAHTRMCYYLLTGLKKKLWSYGLITAVK